MQRADGNITVSNESATVGVADVVRMAESDAWGLSRITNKILKTVSLTFSIETSRGILGIFCKCPEQSSRLS